MIPLEIRDLGSQLDFQETWTLQENLLAQRRDQLIPDQFLLLEHTPVYTIGRTRDQSSLRHPSSLPHPVAEINRGGQATYHGPGQLVGYAIFDLNQRLRDLHHHLRQLEEALIKSLIPFNISAHRRDGLTGVWVDNRKIASLGVGVRSWITLHGFAINIQAISLPPFQFITPCGIDHVTMTSLESETQHPVPMETYKQSLIPTLRDLFS